MAAPYGTFDAWSNGSRPVSVQSADAESQHPRPPTHGGGGRRDGSAPHMWPPAQPLPARQPQQQQQQQLPGARPDEGTGFGWLPTAFATECSLAASSQRTSPQVSPSATSALSSAATMFPRPQGSPMSPHASSPPVASPHCDVNAAVMWAAQQQQHSAPGAHAAHAPVGAPMRRHAASSAAPSAHAAIEQRFNDILSQSAAAMNLKATLPGQPPLPHPASQPHLHGHHSPVTSSGGMHARSLSAGVAPQQHACPDASGEAPAGHVQDDGASEARMLALAAHCPPQLRRKSWSVKQFTLEKVLYVGNISRVLRAVDRATGTTVALKVYKRHNLTDMEKYQVAREIRMHSELYHENIISLFCAWKDAQYIHVAVEWAPNGDIYNMLKRFGGNGVSEPVIVTKIFRPLLSALSFIHARGLIHRDLKPENILLGPNFEIKLSDFGLSINQHQEVANTRLGTLNYIAPEILQCPYKHHPLENKGFGSIGYDNMVDVWSLGVLAYELLTAQLPFCGGGMRETLQKIMLNQVAYPPTISPLALEFISLCLQSNPAQRPTIDQLQQHAWICRAYDGDEMAT